MLRKTWDCTHNITPHGYHLTPPPDVGCHSKAVNEIMDTTTLSDTQNSAIDTRVLIRLRSDKVDQAYLSNSKVTAIAVVVQYRPRCPSSNTLQSYSHRGQTLRYCIWQLFALGRGVKGKGILAKKCLGTQGI